MKKLFLHSLISLSICFAAVSCKADDNNNSATELTLTAPTGLQAVPDVEHKSATLSWEPVANAGSYELSITGSGSYTTPAALFTVFGLNYDTDYTWEVRAKKDDIYSDWSAGAQFRVSSVAVPTGLNVNVNEAKTLVTLSWQAVTNAARYDLYVALNGDTLWYSSLITSLALDNFAYNADCRWAVRRGGDAPGEWSEAATFRVNTNGSVKNKPLPKHQASLKILGIGNSYTDDAMEYLPNLLKSAGITNVTLGKLYYGGGSLEDHYNSYQNNAAYERYNKSVNTAAWQTFTGYTFTQAVKDEPWDIIILQQQSGRSGQYETYQPYLNNLIPVVVDNCSNPDVRLGWQMTWAAGSWHTSLINTYGGQETMYRAIVNAVRTMTVATGIDLIIPSGTAIQNLRATSLNNPPQDLTRDEYSHLDLGAGRYTAACTWFQALIAPCFDTTVVGNTYTNSNGNVPANAANAPLCREAAVQACVKKFEITAVSD